MKATIFVLAASVAACIIPCNAAEEIRIGDRRESVIQALGAPTARISIQKKEWLTYDRGQVVIVDGLVNSFDLMSPEAFAAKTAVEAARAEQKRAELAALIIRRTEEGSLSKERALNDPSFLASAGSLRLGYWQSFARRYPETDISLELAIAQSDAREEELARQAQLEQIRRVESLEQRVASAEARASQAEKVARENSYRRPVLYGYPYGYVVQQPYCPTPRPAINFQLDGPVGDVHTSVGLYNNSNGYSGSTYTSGYGPFWQCPTVNISRGVAVEAGTSSGFKRVSF